MVDPVANSSNSGGGNASAGGGNSNTTGSTGSSVPPNVYVTPTTVWPPPAYTGKVRFDVWEAQLDMYMDEMGITEKPKMVRALLQHIGSEMFEKIIDWTAPKKPQELEYDILIKLIRDKCTKKPNLFALRVKFFNEQQQPGQTLEQYFAHMTRLYGQCELTKMTAENFGVLAFLKGIANDDTRQHLMTSSTAITTMAKVQELATNFEQGIAAAQEIKGNGRQAKQEPYGMNVIGKGARCRYCGEGHQPGKERCPANGKSCSKCGKVNHFAKVCKSEARKHQQNVVEKEYSESLNGIYGVLTVSSRHEEHIPPSIVEVKLDGTAVNMQHDSGSGLSIISKKVWNTIGQPRMHPSSVQLESYNQRITVIGQCKVTVQVGAVIKQEWIVVVPKGVCLFGRNWIQAFNGQLQRLCNTAERSKRGEHANSKQQAVNFVQHSVRRASNGFDKSSYLQNKISKAEHMHVPMQGKENELSGKDMNQSNGRFSAGKSRAKTTGDTVLKGFKLQEDKQSKCLNDKGNLKLSKFKPSRDMDRADLYFKRRMQSSRDTVIQSDRGKTTDEQAYSPGHRRDREAFTGRDKASQYDRVPKIHKNSSYKSGGVDVYKFELS